MADMLPTESLDELFEKTVSSKEWQKAQKDFNASKIIFVVGNGGNLAVADHGSIDVTRLSKKLAICPGSGILATSVIGDSTIDTWFMNWLQAHINAMNKDQLENCMIIGISSSGTAKNISSCIKLGAKNDMRALMISSRTIENNYDYNVVQIGTDYYHTGEVLSLLLFYQLIHGSGCECPSISKKVGKESFDRIVNNNNFKLETFS